MANDKVNLSDLFNDLQSQMISKLSTNRKHIGHAPSKGASSEYEWINWLNSYLPKRYKATSAFVIDSENEISEQIDLVIHDTQYSPFVFNQSNIEYIPAESVYAIFEVKQELDSENIKYAKNKIESVRSLRRTSAQIVHAGGTYNPKDPHNIIGGIITLTSTYDLEKSDAFKKNIIDENNQRSIDLGLCLDKGTFIIKDNEVEISNKNNSLLIFFLNLLSMLQKVGTVTAMDIDEYKRHIK